MKITIEFEASWECPVSVEVAEHYFKSIFRKAGLYKQEYESVVVTIHEAQQRPEVEQ